MDAWQLYLFAITNLLGIFLLFMDWCNLLTGRGEACNSSERVYSFMFSYCMLYVGVFFLVMAHVNKGDKSKLKRLTKFASNAAVATFVGIIFTGSSKGEGAGIGGFERSWMHIGDMIYFFVLYILLVSSMSDDTPAAPRNNCRGGWGVNPKSLVFLIMILVILKLFWYTDFMPIGYLLQEPDSVSGLTHLFAKWCAVWMFEIILALVFVHEYGGDKEEEAAVWVIVGMEVFAYIMMKIKLSDDLSSSVMSQSLWAIIVVVVLGLLSIYGGRKGWGGTSSGSSGYESVPATNV